jgi:hypothetical protein
MFGRNRRRPTQAQAMPTVHPYAVPIADPDRVAIDRERAIRHEAGRALQGNAGYVVDYDRGDPEHSYTRVVQGTTGATAAIARIGMRDAIYLPTSEVYDTGSTDAELTAYQAAMLARINR